LALVFPEIEHDRTHLNRMASKLSFARFAWKDFGRLLLRTLMKFCRASMAIGAFVGLVGFSHAFEDELLGITMLAGLTAGAFPGWRGARLSTV
jgi:putative ABC transport system permease protein